MKAPTRGSTTIACPSCQQPVDVALQITSGRGNGKPGTTLRVTVDESFMATFERHVLDAPDAHPEFMLDDAEAPR